VRCSLGAEAHCWLPNLFVGVGVVSATPSGSFNVLSSGYLGAEWEIGPISLQLLPLGARRDTVLADGFHVGDALPAGTTSVPTATRVHYACGASVTFDADVLKVAGVSAP
jgi:hypothetical protein